MKVKTKFDKNGNIRARFFVDNKGNKSGWYRSFYTNGQIHTECNYQENKRHGEVRIYSPSGFLKKAERYSNGILQRRLCVFHYPNEKYRC